jgi:hypothetical protein
VPKTNVDGLTQALAESVAQPRRVRSATPALVQQYFGAEAVHRAYEALYQGQRAQGRGQRAKGSG